MLPLELSDLMVHLIHCVEEICNRMHARDKGVLLVSFLFACSHKFSRADFERVCIQHPKFSKMLHGYLKMLIPTVTSLICCLTDLAKISEDIWRMAGGLLAVTRERGCFVVHVENEGLRSEFSYAESLKPVDAEKVRRTFNKGASSTSYFPLTRVF